MDHSDLLILSRLISGPCASNAALGRMVGLTGKAARLRRERLERNGVITDYVIHPRAELLGRYALGWGYRCSGKFELPVAQLKEIPDLVYVRRYWPNLFVAVRFTVHPDEGDDPRLSKLLGEPFDGPLDSRPAETHLGPGQLSRLDWLVMDSVVRNPRFSVDQHAAWAGTTPWTFVYHRDRLGQANLFERSSMIDLEGQDGLAIFGIWLKVNDSFDANSLDGFRSWLPLHWTTHPKGVYLSGSANNYLDARRVEHQLSVLPGVASAETLVPWGGYFARDRMIDWITRARGRLFARPSARSSQTGSSPHRSTIEAMPTPLAGRTTPGVAGSRATQHLNWR